MLVREPTNPYDHNAVRAVNQSGEQVGHIERRVAAQLSPSMAIDPLVRVEGLVLHGANNIYKIPIRLEL